MISLSLDSSKLEAKLAKLLTAVNDFKQPLRATSLQFQQDVRKNFATQGGHIAGGWKPRKGAYSHPILVKTGKLMASTYQKKLTKSEVSIANKAGYYKYHQTGTSKMAQRQVLGISSGMEMGTMNRFRQYIERALS